MEFIEELADQAGYGNQLRLGRAGMAALRNWRNRSNAFSLRGSARRPVNVSRPAAVPVAVPVAASSSTGYRPSLFRRASSARRRRFSGRRRLVYRRRRVRFSRSGYHMRSRSIYRRRSKRMRPGNKGSFSIRRFLANGGELPRTTYSHMTYRNSRMVTFDSAGNRDRAFVINSIPQFWASSPWSTSQVPQWQYLDLFRLFYSRYQILGSKTTFNIKRAVFPSYLAPIGGPTNPNSVRLGSMNPGYWYVRVYYKRFSETDWIGDPINITTTPAPEGNWPKLRDFLVDPTVTWVKDTQFGRAFKSGYSFDAANAGLPQPVVPGTDNPGRFMLEYESSGNEVRLSLNFSFKKHFGVRDRNVQIASTFRESGWTETWDTNGRAGLFYAQLGYASFDADNVMSSNIPFDRVVQRTLSVESRAYVKLSGPNIGPNTPLAVGTILASSSVNEEALNALEYAINANPDEDQAKSEFETELDQEIQNLLEGEEEEEDTRESDLEGSSDKEV